MAPSAKKTQLRCFIKFWVHWFIWRVTGLAIGTLSLKIYFLMISGMQSLLTSDSAVMGLPVCAQLSAEHPLTLLPKSFGSTPMTLSSLTCGAWEWLFMPCLQLSYPSRDRTSNSGKRTFWPADTVPSHPSPPKCRNYLPLSLWILSIGLALLTCLTVSTCLHTISQLRISLIWSTILRKHRKRW
jgi:hypothetical protein